MPLSKEDAQALRERARSITDDEVRALLRVACHFKGTTKRHIYDSIVYALAGTIPELREISRETCAVVHMISRKHGYFPTHGDDG